MNRLSAELQRMPKAPVGDVITSVAAQTKIIFLTGIGLMLLAAALYGISLVTVHHERWEIAAAVCSALSPTPLLVSILMALWVYVQGAKRRKLASGEYYVHWRYHPDQWAMHCTQSLQKNRKILPILVGCGAFAALAFAFLVHFDDDRLFYGTLWTHYGMCMLIGASAGVIVGLYCQHLGNMTHALKQNREAQSLIGPGGVYITGQFWPRATFGHQLLAVQIDAAAPDQIQFLFAIRTNHGTTESQVPIPIPPDQQQVAKALVMLLQKDLSS